MTDISLARFNYLSLNFNKPWFSHFNSLRNAKKNEQRWEFCLSIIKHFMPFPITKAFYDAYVRGPKVDNAEIFIKKIMDEYKEYVLSKDEFTEDQKNKFRYNVDSYELELGFNKKVLDDTNLLNFYEGWNSNETEFFELGIHVEFKWLMQNFRKLTDGFSDLDNITGNREKNTLSDYEFSFEYPVGVKDGVFCKDV